MASAKFAAVLGLIREQLARGRQTLVFSRYVTVLTRFEAFLEAEGIPYLLIKGSSSNRDATIGRFQAGEAPVFALSTLAASAGATLHAADLVIELASWWNPCTSVQARARAWRFGQVRPVRAVQVVLEGTIDEWVIATQQRKLSLIDAVLNEGDFSRGSLGVEDLEELIQQFQAPPE